MLGFEKLMLRDIIDPTALLGALLYGLILLIIASALAHFLRLAVERLIARDTRGMLDPTMAIFLTQLAQVGIYVITLIFYAHLIPMLRSLGTALLAGAGIASIVLGLAAQNALGNLIAGISILLYRPFRVGDRVQINAPSGLETGDIESVTLGYTVLKTFDNRRIVIPNSAMANQVTINLTTEDPRVMAVVPFGIGYASDIDKARSILMALIRNHPLVREAVGCPVTQLKDSSVTLSVRGWCANPGDAKQVEYDLYEQAKKEFERENIELPYPYTNVILKKEE